MKRVALKDGWVWASVLLLGASVAVGCGRDDDDTGELNGGGAAGSNAESPGGGGSKSDGGAGGGDEVAGAAGLAGEAGNAATCDCGDASHPTVPLECVCEGGVCEPAFESALEEYRTRNFALPYYVLLGTCADGYRSLSFGEATEQSGRRVFDADGRMVFDRFGGYGGIVPVACGFDNVALGSVTIGEDLSADCSYCLLRGEDGDAGGGGAGGAGADPFYRESSTPPCALE